MLRHERIAWAEGYPILAGVDEVGRGPLAGPVLAAAVSLPRDFLERSADGLLAGLTDSKQLTAARREAFYNRLIKQTPIAYGLGRAEVEEIDALNVLRATHLAMARAVAAMGIRADLLLVDGRPVPGLPVPSRAIVKGDAQSLLIAAASVIAKVTRDREMDEWDRRHPGYGFAHHKGYGTAAHLAALARLGPSAIHRRSFAPVIAAASRLH